MTGFEDQALMDRFKITPVVNAEPVKPFPLDVELAEREYHEAKRVSVSEGSFGAVLGRSGTVALGG